MPPKLIRLSTLTRSQSREQGLDFTWSRQLGGSVEITTKEIEQDSQAGQHEDPADKLSNTSVAIEIEVEVSSTDGSRRGEAEDQGSHSSLEWDNNPDIRNPLLSTDDDILRRYDIDSILGSEASEDCLGVGHCPDLYPQKSWSISVNRLDRLDPLEVSPERRPRKSSSTPNLLNIAAEVHSEDTSREVSLVNNVFEMDQDQYDLRCEEFDDMIVEIEDGLEEFTSVEVRSHHSHEDVAEKLNDTKTRYDDLKKGLRNFYKEFGKKDHPEWFNEWEAKLKNVLAKYKARDTAVWDKVEEIKEQERLRAVPKPVDKSTDSEITDAVSREKDAVVGRAQSRRKYLLNAMKDLRDEVKKAAKTETLKDFNIVKFLKESRKWVDEAKHIDRNMLELEELVVLYPLPSDQKDELENMHQSMKKDLKQIVGDLEAEDLSRNLYTLSQSSSKDSIPYPVFRAKPDDDVHKFLAEFKDALVRNQIPTKDQVKILRTSSLKNFALEVVHKDVSEIEEAYKILLKQFGNADQVFASKFKIFMSECERKWPEIGVNPKEVYQKMTKLITQLDDLQKLVDNKSVDKGELFNSNNVKRLFTIVPTEITIKVYEKIDDERLKRKSRPSRNVLRSTKRLLSRNFGQN